MVKNLYKWRKEKFCEKKVYKISMKWMSEKTKELIKKRHEQKKEKKKNFKKKRSEIIFALTPGSPKSFLTPLCSQFLNNKIKNKVIKFMAPLAGSRWRVATRLDSRGITSFGLSTEDFFPTLSLTKVPWKPFLFEFEQFHYQCWLPKFSLWV